MSPSLSAQRQRQAPGAPLATAGGVEVLGPESDAFYQAQGLACVSPLPGFGERAGPGLPPDSSGSLAVGPANAAAPATMGCGGIPLVVGSPLGLPRNELLDYLHALQVRLTTEPMQPWRSPNPPTRLLARSFTAGRLFLQPTGPAVTEAPMLGYSRWTLRVRF